MNDESTNPKRCGSASCGCESKPKSPPAATDSGRRAFIGGLASAGIAGLLLASGVRLIEVAQAAPTAGIKPGVRWGMLIDTNKCARGCNDCVTACQTEHGWPTTTRTTDAQWIRKLDIKEISTGREHSLPMLCQHCAEPPCVDVCPTGASFKRADGIVLVNKHTCIGCRYCMLACPYSARSFINAPVTDQKLESPRGKGTVESCTLCVHKVDVGEQPACVQACSSVGHEAMVFGDLNDSQSEISQRMAQHVSRQVREDLNLNTGVRYLGI